jgi:hypothetical protein
MKLMGHTNIEQTAIYARFSNDEALGIFRDKMEGDSDPENKKEKKKEDDNDN